MRKTLLFMLVVISSFKALSQQEIKENVSCDFLKNIKFNKGVAIVSVKVTYQEIARFDNDTPVLNKLAKEGKILKNNFTTQIGFSIKGCPEEFAAPCNSLNPYLLKKHPIGAEILIVCKVFEGYKYSSNSNMPFFIVTKAEVLKNKD